MSHIAQICITKVCLLGFRTTNLQAMNPQAHNDSATKIGLSVMICTMKQAFSFVLLLAQAPISQAVIVRLTYDLIRNNLIGRPEFFREQKWPLDPNAGERRRADFVKTHGYHSAKTIEKLGLGTDGYQERRREEQRLRDLGVPTQLPHTVPGGIPPQLEHTNQEVPSYPDSSHQREPSQYSAQGTPLPYAVQNKRVDVPLSHQTGFDGGDGLASYYGGVYRR